MFRKKPGEPQSPDRFDFIEGSMGAAVNRNGFQANFSWSLPHDKDGYIPQEVTAITHLPFRHESVPYIHNGWVSVYTHPLMRGLPHSVENIRLDLIDKKPDLYALERHIGVKAVLCAIRLTHTHDQPVIESIPIILKQEEIAAMENRKATYYPPTTTDGGGDANWRP